MGSRVTDRDRGYRALMASIDAAKRIRISVGIQKEEGAASAEGGQTVADVAEANEFGIGAPARPAISNWADENEAEGVQQMKADVQAAMRSRTSPAQRLDARAQVFAGSMQAKISAGVPPPNAPSTVAKKGSSTPLIDTGQFRSSIRGKVEASG